MEIKNAKITGTSITMGDHGCLTFRVWLEGEGWGCGFGGYCIGHGYEGAKEDEFIAENGDGLVAMMRIMNTVGVDEWEDLKNKYVRCKVNGIGDGVDEIGHITSEKWFNIRKFFEERRKSFLNSHRKI